MKLKPCPFCGGKVYTVVYIGRPFQKEEQAIKAWNKRVDG